MESTLDHEDALACLAWQIELGATEAITDQPINRYDVPEKTLEPASVQAPALIGSALDPVAEAQAAASAASTLEELRKALDQYPHCDLRRGAHNLVFSDGMPEARLMVIGEAPGREEDLQGKPFVGQAGQLLDRMFAAIGFNRSASHPEEALYITNVMPWRPPQNRYPTSEEIAMMRPFVQRHVDLIDPEVIVLMGNISCEAALGKRGITRLRGHWTTAHGKPAMPMFHPAYLLQTHAAKREAWADLLTLKSRLGGNR